MSLTHPAFGGTVMRLRSPGSQALAAAIELPFVANPELASERADSQRRRVEWQPLDAACDGRINMAHAIVMQVKLPQERSPDDAQRMLEEVVIPLAKSQVGFENGTWLHDGKGSGMGVIVFATAENAESAQAVLKPPPGGPEMVSSELYEVGGQA